ncbi:MAG TPA: SDR family NAD(P)-dependent oxidoreductase [Vicinamibacterales bacterium]|nr:SDR family NAD(P)-dependent oxidoreductase [Vicinamibacterales bacterium]
MPSLKGHVAVVAGATRGAGRGIARMLGEAGATVYCTGRSSRGRRPPPTRPETIEETAELVTTAGGQGIAVRVDHSVEAEVAALFARVRDEAKRLDVLVNVFTGPPTNWKSFLEEPPAEGRRYVDAWFWPRVVNVSHAAPIMAAGKSGLIIELVEQDGIGYHGAFYFDIMETLLKRLVFSLAHDLEPSGIAAIAVAPGFMRTEAILEGYGVTEANWRDALSDPRAAAFGWGGSETPCFVGRAVAALAGDVDVLKRSGGIYTARELADEYGFTDRDGNRPDHTILDEAAKKTMESGFLAALKRQVPHAWELRRLH